MLSSADLIAGLTAAFAQIAAAPDVRAWCWPYEEVASLCAGTRPALDADHAAFSWDENHADASRLAEMFWVIDRCPVPVIARIRATPIPVAWASSPVPTLPSLWIAPATASAGRLGLLPGTIAPYGAGDGRARGAALLHDGRAL